MTFPIADAPQWLIDLILATSERMKDSPLSGTMAACRIVDGGLVSRDLP